VRKHPLAFAALSFIFLVLLALLVWQGSFSFPLHPADSGETILLSAVSIIIFILLATLAFILFRDTAKLYIDRQNQREGSRIRSKLLFGAIALTVAPTLFSALFNYMVLNRTLEKWFTTPTRGIQMNLQELDKSYRKEAQARVQAQADWLGLLPETREAALTGHVDANFFKSICEKHGIRQLALTRNKGVPLLLYQLFKAPPAANILHADADVTSLADTVGHLTVLSAITDYHSQK
jgi:two-component system nitrogen regulation sensor histidine kinase NtrY